MVPWCTTVDEQDENHDDMIYVNLPDNKESYTAYDGGPIWRAIYEENCLKERLTGLNLEESCNSETLLYQLISGMHASISLHIAARYYDMDTDSMYMNHGMFYESVGAHPDRVKNLHLVYALALRAVNLLHD